MLRAVRAGMLSTVVCVGLIGGAPAAVGAATPTPYDTNLVRNAGAEEQPDTIGEIPGWTLTSSFERVQYDAGGGFPSAGDGPSNHGSWFFSCGNLPTDDIGQASQTIPITGRNRDIRSGNVRVVLSGWLAGFADQIDFGALTLTAVDRHGTHLSRELSTIPSFGTDNQFVPRSVSGLLPISTRALIVHLVGHRAEGDYCDAFFDNIDVRIVKATNTPLAKERLKNPGAEKGPISNHKGWLINAHGGLFKAYADAGFPSPAQSNAFGGGDRFLCDRNGAGFLQLLTVAGHQADFASHAVQLKVTAKFAVADAGDEPMVNLLYTDGFDNLVGEREIVADPTQAHHWATTSKVVTIQKGTERIYATFRVRLTGKRVGDCGGYVDNASLKLSQ